jgi:hypothetical protein
MACREPIDRFMDLVVESHTSRLPVEGPCWIWQGHHVGSSGRYGRFRPTTRQTDPQVYAHRWSYEHFVGPIPDGLMVDHLCEVKSCVNPAHLESVTPAENNRRYGARMTMCQAGLHDMRDPSNIKVQGTARTCRECIRIRDRARRRR